MQRTVDLLASGAQLQRRASRGSKASSHYERIPAQRGALLEKYTERLHVRDGRAEREENTVVCSCRSHVGN